LITADDGEAREEERVGVERNVPDPQTWHHQRESQEPEGG
jgi:hypothetical protein